MRPPRIAIRYQQWYDGPWRVYAPMYKGKPYESYEHVIDDVVDVAGSICGEIEKGYVDINGEFHVGDLP